MHAQAEPDLEHIILLNVRVFLDESPPVPKINFSLGVRMTSSYVGNVQLFTELTFTWSMNESGDLVITRELKLPYTPYGSEGFELLGLQTSSCLQLNELAFPYVWMQASPSEWNVRIDGSTFEYVPSTPVTMIPVEPSSLSTVSNDQSEARSSIFCVLKEESSSRRVLELNFTLHATAAHEYELDFSPIEKLSSRIDFDLPQEVHAGLDMRSNRSLLIVRSGISRLTLLGHYHETLLGYVLRPVSLPFVLDFNLTEGQTMGIGPELTESIVAWAVRMADNDTAFLNNTRVFAPETVGRLTQARSDLSDFRLLNEQVTTSYNTFPLERSLRLTLEAHEEIEGLVFSSGLVVVPIALVVVFVVAATASHLLFNGSRAATVNLLVGLYLLAFWVHPGLRLFIYARNFWLASDPTSGGSSPFVMFVVVSGWFSLLLLVFAANLVFKYSGTTSIYSLAASTAVRLVKSRKLRGALTIIAITVVAAATVTSVTLQTIFPVVSEAGTRVQDGKTMVYLSNSWSLLVVTSPGGPAVIDESTGIFPMSSDEVNFIAEKLGLEEYTPICISAYTSPNLTGSIVFANLTFLTKYWGAGFEESTSSGDSANSVFLNEDLFARNHSLPDWLAIEGVKLRVAGSFRASALLMPSGKGIEDYLKANELFIGVPDWGSLISLPWDLPTNTRNRNGKFIIPTPIVGVADIRAARNLSAYDCAVLVIGTHPEEEGLADVEEYLRALVTSNKVGFSYTIVSVKMDFVSSYSATVARGSEFKTFRVSFPVVMALGSWQSQLVLMSIGTLIVLSVVLNSTYERRREATVMSSLGASPKFITYSFVAEGLMLGVIGASIGYVLGYVWAYWIGVSSPEIAAELHTMTPLILVLLTSIVVAIVGSAFPAKEAILRVVPSKAMLSREIGSVKIERDGSRRVSVPLRLRENQLDRFSSLIAEMVQYPSAIRYGVTIRSHERVANGERVVVDYRGLTGVSERWVTYEVKIEYISIGEFYHVALVIRSPEGTWTRNHQFLLKNMAYDLRDELLKTTLSSDLG
jgi:hypothetical protein